MACSAPGRNPWTMSPYGIRMAACKARPIACGWSSTSATWRWRRGESCRVLMSTGFLLIHAKPNRLWAAGLSWFLFVVVVARYLFVAVVRHRENPEDRVAPTVAPMASVLYHTVRQPA